MLAHDLSSSDALQDWLIYPRIVSSSQYVAALRHVYRSVIASAIILYYAFPGYLDQTASPLLYDITSRVNTLMPVYCHLVIIRNGEPDVKAANTRTAAVPHQMGEESLAHGDARRATRRY